MYVFFTSVGVVLDEMIQDEYLIASRLNRHKNLSEKDDMGQMRQLHVNMITYLHKMMRYVLDDNTYEVNCDEPAVPVWFGDVIRPDKENEADMINLHCAALYELQQTIRGITKFWGVKSIRKDGRMRQKKTKGKKRRRRIGMKAMKRSKDRRRKKDNKRRRKMGMNAMKRIKDKRTKKDKKRQGKMGMKAMKRNKDRRRNKESKKNRHSIVTTSTVSTATSL